MRFVMLAAAVFAAVLPTVPAQAVVFSVAVSGTVTGVTERYNCSPPGLPGMTCLPTVTPGSFFVSSQPRFFDFVEGDNAFSIDQLGSREGFSGIINNTGGILTGVSLRYIEFGCIPAPRIGCVDRRGSTTTFQVAGGPPPVPEPATWLMLILGFGLIGQTLRKRSRPLIAA